MRRSTTCPCCPSLADPPRAGGTLRPPSHPCTQWSAHRRVDLASRCAGLLVRSAEVRLHIVRLWLRRTAPVRAETYIPAPLNGVAVGVVEGNTQELLARLRARDISNGNFINSHCRLSAGMSGRRDVEARLRLPTRRLHVRTGTAVACACSSPDSRLRRCWLTNMDRSTEAATTTTNRGGAAPPSLCSTSCAAQHRHDPQRPGKR